MSDLLSWHATQWDQLQRAVANRRIPHAILLTGAEGIGKSRFASLLANGLVCDAPDSAGLPCGQCKACHLFQERSHPDIHRVEPEEKGKQIRIESIRDLVSRSILSVNEASFRVFIIDPADAMNTASTNALLKTLEEPVPGTLLLLVSSYPSRLPATIKSRCQEIRFQLPIASEAGEWLAQQVDLEPELAESLLGAAAGAPMIALEILRQNQLPSYIQGLDDFLSLIPGTEEPVRIAERWHKAEDPKRYLGYMTAWLHDLIRLKSGGEQPRMIPANRINSLKTLINQLNLKQLYATLDFIYEIQARLINNLNLQLALERILLYWAQVNSNGAK